MERSCHFCATKLVAIGLIDCLEFGVDLLKCRHQGRLEMLGEGATVSASDDLGSAGMGEAVLVRTRTAQRVVHVDQMDQPCGCGDLGTAQPERIAAAIPV